MPTKRKPGAVLSVDLAHRRYTDNGIAYLESGTEDVQIIKAVDLGLSGTPSPSYFAAALAMFCEKERVSVLLLDGPQGWRYPHSQIEHMRLCERVLNTPGKTGVVGTTKPRTYLAYIQFSIDLFQHLRLDQGWELLTADWTERPGMRWLVESFPTSAWKTLGLPKLPAKAKTTSDQLTTWRCNLSIVTGLKLPDPLTHDELQAAVVLPAGRAIANGDPERVILSGIDPLLTDEGIVLEGWIANPCVP